MNEQWIVFGVLALTFVLFIHGKLRYDIVALMALLVLAVSGILPASEVFVAFGHPAVVTVGAVLVVSRGLLNAGVVSAITRVMSKVGKRPTLQVAALTGLVAVLSSFINNVGALALLMPVAIRMARQSGKPPSLLLLPLAFGSLLGGTITLIGRPPNILVASFRQEATGEAFGMFEFAPVGLGVAVAGVAFISLLGWRLLPRREGGASREEMFEIEKYLAEVRVPDTSRSVGRPLREVQDAVENEDVIVVGLVRDGERRAAPSAFDVLQAGDVLIVEANSEALETLLDGAQLELGEQRTDDRLDEDDLDSDDVGLVEAIVTPESRVRGRSAKALDLHLRHGVNLLAVARQGKRLKERIADIRMQVGDVLLLQGQRKRLQDALSELGCLPLAERELALGRPQRMLLALAIFVAAVTCAATGLLPVPVAFVGAAVLMVLVKLLSPGEAYESIDFSILILVGALLPLGDALERTGGADFIAGHILSLGDTFPVVVTLVVVMAITMVMSDLVSNDVATVLMAPIAIAIAGGLGVSIDPFLMAVAVGASAAFLTPIGQQSNLLVMEPGGYRFTDYWRMGLPVELLVMAVAIPLILLVWPF